LWSENPITPTYSTSLTIVAGSSAPTGTFTATVSANSGTVARSHNFTLTVQAAPSPACELYPMIIPLSRISSVSQGTQVVVPYDPNNGAIPGTFNWVYWDSTVPSTSVGLLEDNLIHPENAGTDFKEAGDPDDTVIDANLDWVVAMEGVYISSAVNSHLYSLQLSGLVIQMPVWNDLCTGEACTDYYDNSGTRTRYKMLTFVAMRLTGIYLVGNNPPFCGPAPRCLIFEFSHLAPNACPGNGY
jgi:hypothetical protein